MYDWIRGFANEPVSIYTFSSHGSKNIFDLNSFSDKDANGIFPEIVCHDQEPLNFNLYQTVNALDLWAHVKKLNPDRIDSTKLVEELAPLYQNLNFFAMLRVLHPLSIFDRYILLHSEKNSTDVENFSVVAEPVYYWSHAIIARDWYRYAKHDVQLTQPATSKKTFLVYCRAWTGSREYRLKFVEQLISNNLINQCYISILHQDEEHELSSYKCSNTILQPADIKELTNIDNNNCPASLSANYSADDIINSDISVVLETIAADTKIHLTEKTLRPIACGHPFILVAGPGSLNYLKSYGFKTFSPWIDESYDHEPDIIKRMELIINEMRRIQNLSADQKNVVLHNIRKVADYNKHYFFSENFTDIVCKELSENLNQAIKKIKNTQGKHYFITKKMLKKIYTKKFISTTHQLDQINAAKILRRIRQDPTTCIKDLLN